jgi:hypothetical protein
MPDDRIQREIEDILNRIDDFVPEENKVRRFRRRSSTSKAMRNITEPLSRISLRHVLLAGLALVVIGFFAGRAHPIGTWMLIAGVILFLTSFALSFFTRNTPSAPPAAEKRWRGRPLELDEPTFSDRLRAWFGSRRRTRW